jgi:hypothetical protein
MSKYLPGAIGIAVLLIASTALAKERMALDSASVGNARADCSGATTDGVVEASARIQFNAEAHFVPPSAFEATPPILVVPTFPLQWFEVDHSYPLPLLIKAPPAC